MKSTESRAGAWLPGLVILYAFVSRVYFVVRHQGRWLDADTVGIARDADKIWLGAGLPTLDQAFGSSFGQPVLLGYWARALGISTSHYQQIVHPIVGMMIVLAAYVFARRIWENPIRQAVAVFLVASAPDVFFETVRGSHGALAQSASILLAAASMPVLLRRVPFRPASVLLGLTLLMSVALLNGRRGVMVAGALAATITAFVIVRRWIDRPQERTRLVATAGAGVIVIVFLAAYAVVNRASFSRFLARPSEAASLEGYGAAAWKEPWVYVVLAAWNVIVTLGALGVWLVLARGYLKLRTTPRLETLWAWSLAFGFGLVLFFAILGGYVFNVLNFVYPLRAFVYACMFFAFLATVGVPWVRRTRLRKLAAIVLVALFAVAAPLKGSGEPALNRHWRFSDPHEAAALVWLSSWRDPPPIWTGSENPNWETSRLVTTYYRVAPIGVWPLDERRDSSAPALVWSDTVAAHARETGTSPPPLSEFHGVYDNGGASIWLRRAEV